MKIAMRKDNLNLIHGGKYQIMIFYGCLFKAWAMAGKGKYEKQGVFGPAGSGDDMNQKSDKPVQGVRLTQCVKGAG